MKDALRLITGREIGHNGEWVYLEDGYPKVEKKHIKQAEQAVAEREREALAQSVREERDWRLRAVLERIQRYQLQELAECETDDSKAVFEQLLQLAQALRGVPEQEGFPENVEWPEL